MSTSPTAAVLLIGNELLSGSVQDCNLQHIAKTLESKGITIKECRIVADIEQEIVDGLNALRGRYDYVFTTGGVGPTHDDITSDSIAKAFGVANVLHKDIDKKLIALFKNKGIEYTVETQRMAHAPEDAKIIYGSDQVIPCYQIGNVFVLAGVPRIMQNMLDDCLQYLPSGDPMLSVEVHANVSEGEIAKALGEIQRNYPTVDIGSYPQDRNSTRSNYGVVFVIRGQNKDTIANVQSLIYQECLENDFAAEII